MTPPPPRPLSPTPSRPACMRGTSGFLKVAFVLRHLVTQVQEAAVPKDAKITFLDLV